LRQQLAVYKRMMTRPRLRRADRLFWVGLARIWAGWRQCIVIVTPDTVLRWQRRRFREYWTQPRLRFGLMREDVLAALAYAAHTIGAEEVRALP
jgi:hypothetical protein